MRYNYRTFRHSDSKAWGGIMPKSPDRPELSQDALVEALVPDPSGGPPDATVLRGYLGRGTAEGTWRLYLTAALDDYVEIPADKILYTHKLPEDRGTMVWVPKGLSLQRKQITSEAVQAEFLAGSIEQGRVAAITETANIFGPVYGSEFCPSVLPFRCPSESVICYPSFTFHGCPSVSVINCPSWRPLICISNDVRLCGGLQSDLPRYPC